MKIFITSWAYKLSQWTHLRFKIWHQDVCTQRKKRSYIQCYEQLLASCCLLLMCQQFNGKRLRFQTCPCRLGKGERQSQVHLRSQRGHCTIIGTTFVLSMHLIELLSLIGSDVVYTRLPKPAFIFHYIWSLTYQITHNQQCVVMGATLFLKYLGKYIPHFVLLTYKIYPQDEDCRSGFLLCG